MATGSGVLQILNEVASTSKNSQKESIVKKYGSVPLFIRTLKYALSTDFTFGVTLPHDAARKTSHSGAMELEEAFPELDRLAERSITGNAANRHINSIVSTLNADDAEVFVRIVNRDLKCGIGAKTANRVFGKNFVFEYPVLLASPLNQKTEKNIKFPALCQRKMDGARVNVHIDLEKQEVRYFSRQGKEMLVKNPAMDQEFIEALRADNDHLGQEAVIDGEILAVDPSTERPLPRKQSNGIVNKASSGTISEKEAQTLRVYAWDIVPWSVFVGSEKSKLQYDRYLELYDFYVNAPNFLHCKLVETQFVKSMEEAKLLGAKWIKEGEEGAIIKDRDSVWSDRRATDIVKIKEIYDGDFLVVGQYYGEPGTKNESVLGGISCTSSDGLVQFNVGSGFSEEERQNLLDNIVGKIVKIEYNQIIQSKERKDVYSLYLPIFVDVRDDKSEADSYETLVDQQKQQKAK